MKKLFLSFIILYAEAFAQTSKIDSLKNLLKKDKEDTNKVNHLNKLAQQYFNLGALDSMLHYANTSLQLAQQINFKQGIAKAYNVFGIIYYSQDDYVKALDYYFKVLKLDEELGDKNAADLSNIGNVFNRQKNYAKALNYYLKALSIADTGNRMTWIGNIGGVYHEMKDYPKALDYYFKALKIAEGHKDKHAIATWLSDIGFTYYKQKNTDKALDYFLKAYKIAQELADKNLMAVCLGNMGELYTDTKKYTEAETCLFEALKIDKEIGAKYFEKDIEENLSKLYEQTGREKLGLEHYKKAAIIKDTLFNAEKNKAMALKEMNYEFEKREVAIKAKAEQEKNNLKKNMIIGFTILGLLLLFMFLLFVFRTLRVNTKQRLIMAYNFLRSFVRYPKAFRTR